MAYNQNGDGESEETTASPASSDTAAPELLAARIGSDSLVVRLTYNEALDVTSKPPSSAFSVNVNGASRTFSVDVLENVVTLSLTGVVNTTDVVTVGYTAPTGPTASPVKDSAGNNVADFSAQRVRNDATQVALTSDPGADKTYSWNNGSGGQDAIEATVAFSEPVSVRGVPELELRIGDQNRRAAYLSGSGTNSLIFRYLLSEGEVDTDGISVDRGSIAGVVSYTSTNAVAPARVRLDPQAAHLVDAVRPVLVSADILGNQNDLALTWDEALDEDSVPPPDSEGTIGLEGFMVFDTVDKTRLEISAVSVRGKQVILTMSAAVSASDKIIVSYRVSSLTPLKDTAGNYAANAIAVPVSIRQPNSAPEFPSTEDGARSVDENTPAGRNIGAAIAATDADNDGLTYSISGTDADFFEVVVSSGQLQTRDPLDYERKNSYSFTMSVADGGKDVYGNADTTVDDTINVTVTVNNIDEGPEIFGPTSINDYLENGIGDVASYSATDPEGDHSTFTWSLSGTDSGDFDFDNSTGKLTFRITPDYESPVDSNLDNEYLVTVVAADPRGLRSVLDIVVTVNDVNEPPTITGIQTASFPENGTRSIATYRATDPERETINWSVSGADASFFSVDSQGYLTFNEPPDFEASRGGSYERQLL